MFVSSERMGGGGGRRGNKVHWKNGGVASVRKRRESVTGGERTVRDCVIERVERWNEIFEGGGESRRHDDEQRRKRRRRRRRKGQRVGRESNIYLAVSVLTRVRSDLSAIPRL